MGVFGERGPCEELGELAMELASSSLMAWWGVVGVAITAVNNMECMSVVHTTGHKYVRLHSDDQLQQSASQQLHKLQTM